MTLLATPELYAALVNTQPPDGLLEAVSASIRRYCGWHITPQRTETLVVDGTGGRYLPIRTAHLVSVLAVTNDDTVLDVDDDIEWSESGILKLETRWTNRMRGVTISIVHGYDADEVLDVAMQAVLIAARVSTSPRGEISSAAGGVSATFSSGGVGIALTLNEEAHLAPYCYRGLQ